MAASAGSDTAYGTGLLQPVLERYNLAHEVDEETETYITGAYKNNKYGGARALSDLVSRASCLFLLVKEYRIDVNTYYAFFLLG